MENTWPPAASHVPCLGAENMHSTHMDGNVAGAGADLWGLQEDHAEPYSMPVRWSVLSLAGLLTHTVQDYFWLQVMKEMEEIQKCSLGCSKVR